MQSKSPTARLQRFAKCAAGRATHLTPDLESPFDESNKIRACQVTPNGFFSGNVL